MIIYFFFLPKLLVNESPNKTYFLYNPFFHTLAAIPRVLFGTRAVPFPPACPTKKAFFQEFCKFYNSLNIKSRLLKKIDNVD